LEVREAGRNFVLGGEERCISVWMDGWMEGYIVWKKVDKA